MTPRRHFPYRQAWAILTSIYGQNCSYCHKATATQIDHVIPYAYSKYHGIENLRPACQWCNLIAGDKVFDDFEEKYSFIRKERKAKKKKMRNRRLTCSACLVPYYSAMFSSQILCPYCYTLEYEGGGRLSSTATKAWKEWRETLTLAGFDMKAHEELADYIYATPGVSIPMKDKIEILTSCQFESMPKDELLAFMDPR